jgi:branched-chain amino acid transport system permease protein
MSTFIQVTVNGIASGGLYAALLIGILLIYQLSHVINFAHGQFAMIAGLGSYYLVSNHGVPLGVAIILAVIALAGVAFGTKLLTDVAGKEGSGHEFVLPLGVFLCLTALGQAVLHSGQASNYPRFTSRTFELAGAFIDANVVITIACTVSLVASVFFVLQCTALGLQIRAISADPGVAAILGINARRIRALVWIAAGAAAAIAGVLIAVQVPVDAFYVTPFLINALIAGIFGGLHRVLSPIIVAFGLGIFESWVVFEFGAQYQDVAIFGVAIVALAILPVRWFTESTEARA